MIAQITDSKINNVKTSKYRIVFITSQGINIDSWNNSGPDRLINCIPFNSQIRTGAWYKNRLTLLKRSDA